MWYIVTVDGGELEVETSPFIIIRNVLYYIPMIPLPLFTFLHLQLSFASADYHIGFIVQSIEFLTPRNILANGSCCDSSCGANGIECCDNGCSPSMRICFRESQHLADDPSCPLLEVLRNTAQSLVVLSTNIPPIQRYYTVECFVCSVAMSYYL